MTDIWTPAPPALNGDQLPGQASGQPPGPPRLPLDNDEMQHIIRYVQRRAPAVYANAMLDLFAPGYEAKAITAAKASKAQT